MTTSRRHEKYKHWLGRFLETIAEEANVPIEPGGNMTFQREDLARGLEGDQCYWIAHEPQVRGKLTWDPESDPPPDLALEIEISRSALDRLSIYAALKVPEVWCFDGQTLRVYLLQADGTYQQAENSLAFPMIPPSEIIPFLHRCESEDYLSVVRAFRLWVREQLAKSRPG
jgi:Uma2 family endonuclease